jgi:hypothetical protein
VIEVFFRVSFYLVVGIALLGACTWYVQSLYQSITGRGEVVIAPFEVVGSGDAKNRGTALAHMLHARLSEIERDIRIAQRELTGKHPQRPASARSSASNGGAPPATSSSADAAAPKDSIAMPQLLTQPVELRAGLLEPADINISVGGVQVGGVVAWMQRLVSQPRTLVFTLYESKEGAQLSGSLSSLGMREQGVRIDLPLSPGQDAVPMNRIVEQAAYEIVRQRLAADPSNRVEVLTGTEFQGLVEVLRDTAALNRRVALRRGALPEFQDVLGKVSRLADEVPEWYQINYLAGSVAESAKDLDAASKYFGRVLEVTAKDAAQSDLHGKLSARVAELKSSIAAASPGNDATDADSPDTRSARQEIESYVQTATNVLNALLGHQLSNPRVKINTSKGPERWLSYWDGRQVVAPEATRYLPDAVYRQAAWPHILRLAGSGALDGDDGSTEAILYSYADVFPMLIQQTVLKQDEKTSRWELAPGWVEMFGGQDLAKAKTKTPYMSFAELGTANAAKARGNEQVGHMRDFDNKGDPSRRKYVNSGILNRAFYEAARRLGSAKAAQIWVAALRQLKTTRKVDFQRFAVMLKDAAAKGDQPVLREALLTVGLDPQATGAGA